MGASVITNVRIFDGTGREPFAGEVLVDGNRIAAVTAGGGGPRPEPAAVIDGAGGTLMPGLVEAHAHLSFPDRFSRDVTLLPPEGAHPHHGTERAHDARLRRARSRRRRPSRASTWSCAARSMPGAYPARACSPTDRRSP